MSPGEDPVPCLFQIDDLNKLRGYVSISTPKQALAFVRLRTSPETAGYFYETNNNSAQVEIVERGHFDPDYMFGHEADWDMFRSMPNGIVGIMDRKLVKQFKIPMATCTPVDGGFLITRTLLVENNNSLKGRDKNLISVTEWVGKDGSYVIKEQKPLPYLSAITKDFWFLPHGK